MSSHNLIMVGEANRVDGNKWKWLTLVFAFLSILVGAALAYLVGKTGLFSLLIASVFILVLIAVIRPELALYGLLIVVYTNLSNVLIYQHGLPSVTQPLVGIVFGIILIRAAVFKDRFDGWKSFAFLVVIYGLIGAIALLIAADYEWLLFSSQDYLKDVFIGLEVILLLRTPTHLRRAIWILLITGLFMGSITFYQQVTDTLSNSYWGFGANKLDTNSGLRLAGPVGDPNTYAQIMAVLIPLALERFFNEKRPSLRLLALVILFLCGYAVIFSYSRGGFVAVVIALLFLAIRRPPRPAVAAGILGTLIFVFQLFPQDYVDRLSTLLYFLPTSETSVMQERSFQGRSSENLAAAMMFKDHPLVGVGAGNFNAYYQTYSRRLGIDPRRDERSAHSLYLEVAAERGLLGIAVFFVIVSSAYWSLWRAEKRYLLLGMKKYADVTVALSAGMTAYLAAGLFLHDSFIRYFWVLIGLAWAASSISISIAEKVHATSRHSGELMP